MSSETPGTDPGKRKRRRKIAFVVAGTSLAVEAFALASRGYGLGGNVIVRCRRGHLFTTIWIPGGSLKALRLGFARIQRCPVDGHWSLVVPVKAAELSEDERRLAAEQRDRRIP